MNETNDAVPR
jgi:hypothetical protein